MKKNRRTLERSPLARLGAVIALGLILTIMAQSASMLAQEPVEPERTCDQQCLDDHTDCLHDADTADEIVACGNAYYDCIADCQ